MRGDRPSSARFRLSKPKFTPHARGSTGVKMGKFGVVGVYPACAGIDRLILSITEQDWSLPRMRGDRPLGATSTRANSMFTPHARGSTYRVRLRQSPSMVYPACAGIDRFNSSKSRLATCLPRMRGDRPSLSIRPSSIKSFTPHARGST